MKLYAQHGHGDGKKTAEGLAKKYIDGVILSPKDIPESKLKSTIKQFRTDSRKAEILFDPQFYACLAAVDPASNLGNLGEEDAYAYFQPRRRSQLLSERQLCQDLDATLQFQSELAVSALIAPNILIPRSFDSAEAAISMDFIRNARKRYTKLGDARPMFATLAIARETLLDKEELLRFLNDLTILEDRPDGFYVLVGVNSTEARSEIYHADVIAGWMFINHVLKLNGYRIINGYSDILTPFLGSAGAEAGATGWWSNLRAFSMDRFAPPAGGGRLPIERYLSCGLMNRITFDELGRLRDEVPAILNGLGTDKLYPEESSQPQRNQEVLQSWDAIRQLNTQLVQGGMDSALRKCLGALDKAQKIYGDAEASLPRPFDPKSNDQHVEALQEGLRLFSGLAELDLG